MKWIAFMAGVLALGWFGLEAQRSRDGSFDVWELLSTKYDKNKDDKISRSEYPREASKFDAYDRNGDGTITRADFSGNARSGGRRQGGGDRNRMIGAMVARAADRDRSGEARRRRS